jgi:hypothetical protein
MVVIDGGFARREEFRTSNPTGGAVTLPAVQRLAIGACVGHVAAGILLLLFMLFFAPGLFFSFWVHLLFLGLGASWIIWPFVLIDINIRGWRFFAPVGFGLAIYVPLCALALIFFNASWH